MQGKKKPRLLYTGGARHYTRSDKKVSFLPRVQPGIRNYTREYVCNPIPGCYEVGNGILSFFHFFYVLRESNRLPLPINFGIFFL
jgi:hypothetical protein